MNRLHMKRIGIILACLLGLCVPAVAQWQVPDHSVPIGRGAGTGFKSAAPGTAGLPLLSNGASSDPSFSVLDLSGAGVSGNISNAMRADLNGISEAIASDTYTILAAATTRLNQGSYYNTGTLKLTPPNGARAVHLIGSAWASAGVGTSGANYVAKWIKNWTTNGSGQLLSGTDVCAGVGSLANGATDQASIHVDCYDVPSSSDYYALFAFITSSGGNVTIDGNAAHTFISSNVILK